MWFGRLNRPGSRREWNARLPSYLKCLAARQLAVEPDPHARGLCGVAAGYRRVTRPCFSKTVRDPGVSRKA